MEFDTLPHILTDDLFVCCPFDRISDKVLIQGFASQIHWWSLMLMKDIAETKPKENREMTWMLRFRYFSPLQGLETGG